MHRLDPSCSSAWSSWLRRIKLYANKTKLWRFVAQPCATRSQTVSPCCVREFPLPSGASRGCCARSACKNGLYNDYGEKKYFLLAGAAMGRIREHIKVNGRTFWTLFDTGARNTYVVPAVASLLATTKLPKTFRSALGGTVKKATKAAVLNAEVQGHKISTHAMVVDEIGKDENGKGIEVLFGALAMQQWGIRPVPDEEKLDLSHYS